LLLGHLVGVGLLDLGPQLLEGLALRVILEQVQLALGLLEREFLAEDVMLAGIKTVVDIQLCEDVAGGSGRFFTAKRLG